MWFPNFGSEKKLMKNELTLDSPAIYQIQVQGYLEEHWSDWFDGMEILAKISEENTRVTKLTGNIIDQAALHGLLRKLYDLGLPLLSIKCIDQNNK